MRKLTSVTLISFRPDAHGVHDDPVDSMREVKAEEMSLTSTDRLEAGGQGLSDEAKILIPYDRDYKGERALEYRGERWTVIREDPYKDWNGVILSIRRDKGNSRSAAGPVTPVTTEATEVGTDA